MIKLRRDIRRKRLLNLTPLIDIIFLLVVFFLLTSKFEHSSGVVLSVASGGGDETGMQAEQVLEVYILDDYTLEFNRQKYYLEEFLERSSNLLKNSKKVIVFPSRYVGVQTVVTLMDELRSRGINQIRLIKAGGNNVAS
jgi:biopolymer transport protein ExbD